MAGEADASGFNLPTPGWNSNREPWQLYKAEVRIWLLGTKLNVDYTRLLGAG